MTDECKELEKNAKELEKIDLNEAIRKYKQASECYSKYDNTKDKNSNLAKVAKLLREMGKSIEDPTAALDHYEESSSIYAEIDKKGEAEKVILEAYQKFIDASKLISSEARDMDDINLAEEKFKLASQYAKLGEDEELSNKCWIESGDQIYKAARAIEDPREAFEFFKHSIINYNKGNANEKQKLLLIEAAEKFYKKGSDIYKTNKTLVLAFDNYAQAITIYQSTNSEQKSLEGEKKIQEICDRIGMSNQPIIEYLELHGINAVSFGGIQLDIPVDKQMTEVTKSEIQKAERDIESEPSPISTAPKTLEQIEETPEPMMEETGEKIEIESKLEHQIEEIMAPELELPTIEQSETFPSLEVIEDVKESFPPEVIIPEIDELTPEPLTEELGESIETETTHEAKIEELEVPDDEGQKVKQSEASSFSNMAEEIVPRDAIKPEIHEPTPDPLIGEHEEKIETEIIPEPQIKDIATSILEGPIVEQQVVNVAEKIEKTKPDFESGLIKSEIQEKFSEPLLRDVVEEDIVESILNSQMEEIKTLEVEEPVVERPVLTPTTKMVEEVEQSIPDKFKTKIQEPSRDSKVTVDDEKKNRLSGLKPMAPSMQKELPNKIQSRPKLASEVDGSYNNSPTQYGIKEGMSEEGKPVEKTGNLTSLSEPIIEILKEQGYIGEDMKTNADLLQVSEYQILLFILNNHPVPLEEIEEKTNVSSVSLALSNLQADNLIEQTNDYQWTISKKVKDTIS